MTLHEAALLWFGGLVNVFLMGFQSRNANAGRYWTCASTSFAIAWAQAVFMRAAATHDLATVALLVGGSGSVGICLAIYVSKRLFDPRPVKPTAPESG